MKTLLKFLLFLFIATGCSSDPDLTEDMLGGGTIFDPSLYEPEKFLVSLAHPQPTAEQALKPVIIASHGYTATTFEWDEFYNYTINREDVLVSRVLLGGHGGNYNDFKNSTWQDWQQPIAAEYERLINAGYTNIHLLGSSTSGALFINLISSGYFNDKQKPKQILLVDPIVIPSNKTLSLIHVFGPMLGYLEVDQTTEEDKVFYHFRPQETLRELQNLLNRVRKDLEKGITAPQGTSVKVYKSIKDPTADPVSAVLIHKGLQLFSGEKIDIDMVDSDLHVFTRLELRSFSQKDRQNQQNTFDDILSRVRE